MAKSVFQGTGLTEDQWSRLKGLATSLTPEQANWVGGYFTGYAEARRSCDTAPAIQPLSTAGVAAPGTFSRRRHPMD